MLREWTVGDTERWNVAASTALAELEKIGEEYFRDDDELEPVRLLSAVATDLEHAFARLKVIDTKKNHFSLRSIQDRMMYRDLLLEKDIFFSDDELKNFRKLARERLPAYCETRQVEKLQSEKREESIQKRKERADKKKKKEELLEATPLICEPSSILTLGGKKREREIRHRPQAAVPAFA